MQHLSSNYRAEGVVNGAETEKIYHRFRDGGDMGSLDLNVRYR